MKKWISCCLCICLLMSVFPALTEENTDEALQAMKLFKGEKDGVAFALPGFAERLKDEDNPGYWKDSVQLAGSCAEDGAEFQLRTADISEWLKTYRAVKPNAKDRDVMAQVLYRYSTVILSTFGAETANIKAKTVGEDGLILTYDYTYPDTPGIQYYAKCIIRAGKAYCLTMQECGHWESARDALRMTEEASASAGYDKVDIAGLEAVFPQAPVIREEDAYTVLAAFSEDWSYLSVQYIPGRVSLPEEENERWNQILKVAGEKVMPAVGGSEVISPRLFSLGDGYMLSFSSVSTERLGEYGQRWLLRLYITSVGIWYVYAADTEEGAAFMSRLHMENEAPVEITPESEATDVDVSADTQTAPVIYSDFQNRMEALLASRAYGTDFEGGYWSEPFFTDGHWVHVLFSTVFQELPYLIVYTDGPESDALVTEARALGSDPGCMYGDVAIIASCAAESLVGEGIHNVLRARLAARRSGEAPEETYGGYKWVQSYYSSPYTAEKHHLISISALEQPNNRKAPTLPDEGELPDITGSTMTLTTLVESINRYSRDYFSGMFDASLHQDPNTGAWFAVVGKSVMVRPTLSNETPDSAIRQVWIADVQEQAPYAMAATLIVYAAMTDLSKEEYMALNLRLTEYPFWDDLAGMQPLAAKNGVMAVLSDDETEDGQTLFMGWVAGTGAVELSGANN